MSSTMMRRCVMAWVVVMLLALPVSALAEKHTVDTTLENPLGKVTNISELIGNVVRAGFGIIGSIALLMFVYGGFVWMTSGGNADRVKKGKDTMIWATLGIAVAFTATAIVSFVIGALTRS